MRLWLVLFLGISLLAGVEARVFYVNDTIPSTLGEGDHLTGQLIVRLNSTNADSLVEINLAGRVPLKSLLDAQGLVEGESYNCSVSGCNSGYVDAGAINNVNIVNGSAIAGFVLRGQGVRNLRNLHARFTGSTSPSCYVDLGIDPLAQRQYTLATRNYQLIGCTDPQYGCFENNLNQYDLVTIPSTGSYCENVTLPAAPAYIVGGVITASTQNAPLTMRLYTGSRELLGQCNLPQPTGSAVQCIIERPSAQQGRYQVCVGTSSPSGYKVRLETHQPCGTSDNGQTYAGDYELFAQPLQFGTPSIAFEPSEFANSTGIQLYSYLNSYLEEQYNRRCEPSCALPLRLFGVNQNVGLSEVSLTYDTDAGQGIEVTQLRNLRTESAKINASLIILDLGAANLTVSGNNGSTLEVKIDGESVIRKQISIVDQSAFTLSPHVVLFGRDTEFKITVASPVQRTVWNFGDGSQPAIVNGNSTTHRYQQQGEYSIQVEAVRPDGTSLTRTFSVSVSDPRTAANSSIASIKQNTDSVRSALTIYPDWLQNAAKKLLDFEGTDRTLLESQASYAVAQTDDQFAQIVNNLEALSVPLNITSGIRGSLPFLIGSNAIDVGALEEISNADVDDDALKNAIVSWMGQHVRTEAQFEVVEAAYRDKSEDLLTHYTLKITPVDSVAIKSYLVIAYPNAQITGAPGTPEIKNLGGSSYIELDLSSERTIEFALPGFVSLEQLGLYVSPELQEFNLASVGPVSCNFDNVCGEGERFATCPSDCKPWGFIITALGIIVFLGVAGYIALQWWYKTRYERFLFKNPRDLANIIIFIRGARGREMSDEDIKKKLKASGWDSEQITYAFTKIYNKPASISENTKK